jgi:putative ABC transport system permease protein
MTDEKFCSLYGLKLNAGRFFNINDTSAVGSVVPRGQRFPKCVVNEKLVQELGFQSPQAALGKRFWVGMNDWNAEIVGVVADFNIASLHEAIRPTLITQFLPFCDKIGIKIQAGADVQALTTRSTPVIKKPIPQEFLNLIF